MWKKLFLQSWGQGTDISWWYHCTTLGLTFNTGWNRDVVLCFIFCFFFSVTYIKKTWISLLCFSLVHIVFFASPQMWPRQRPWQWGRGRPGLSSLLLPHNGHGQDPASSRTWSQSEPGGQPQPGGGALPQQPASPSHGSHASATRGLPRLWQRACHLLWRPLLARPVGGTRGLFGSRVSGLLFHWRGRSAAAGPCGQ